MRRGSAVPAVAPGTLAHTVRMQELTQAVSLYFRSRVLPNLLPPIRCRTASGAQRTSQQPQDLQTPETLLPNTDTCFSEALVTPEARAIALASYVGTSSKMADAITPPRKARS